MSDYIRQHSTYSNTFLKDAGWVVLSEIENRIKEKIEEVGIPLKQWDIQINYGIKTGFNEAFIIDKAKRDELVKKSPKAAEIIRPILLGRNIKRYNYKWDGLWIINSHNGLRNKKLERIDVEKDYPVIFNYLQQFKAQLQGRCDQGDTWCNLRNCAYLEEFDKPKIVWGNLALKPQFAYVREPALINAPSPFFVTEKLFLLAILNSKIADFYMKQLGVTRNGGYFEYKPMFVEQLPIPQLVKQTEEILSKLAERLLEENGEQVAILETQIDGLCYDIFKLSEEEREYIDNKS